MRATMRIACSALVLLALALPVLAGPRPLASQQVDRSLAETEALTEGAPLGGACVTPKGTGVCKDVSQCSGTTVAGFCAGSSSIKCCVAGAAASSSSAAAPAAASKDSCTYGGQLGVCQDVTKSTCGGTIYSGLCPGNKNVKCCISGKSSIPSRSNKQSGKQRITLTTLQRLSENVHLARWARFKQVNNKVYATKAADNAAYKIFRDNRVRIIYLNDRFGAGYVMYSSATPFTDVAASTFNSRRLGTRNPPPRRRSLLEATSETSLVESSSESSADIFSDADPHWQAFQRLVAHVEESEAQGVSFLESEELAAIQAEAEVKEKKCSINNESGICLATVNPGKCTTGKFSYASDCALPAEKCCLGMYTSGPVMPDAVNGGGAVGGVLEVDYRNFMKPPRNQEQCGSCWAFASSGLLEAQAARAGITLSSYIAPQWFITCDSNPEQLKCQGGFPHNAYKFAAAHTPALESEYTYEAAPGTSCKVMEGSSGFRVTESGMAMTCPATSATDPCNSPDESLLLDKLKTLGPLTVTVDASQWQWYANGILPAASCSSAWDKGNHAVVLTGYGSEDGKNFWLLRNSWTSGWGEEGYVRVEARVGNGCGLANYVSYAKVGRV